VPISTKLCWNEPWVVTVLTDTILKGDHPWIISAKFGWDWLCSFRGEDFFLISSPLFSNLLSFLTYITEFLWTLNFCLFWPIMQIRKKGGWN
jgi:hypothetical protein